MSGYVFQIMRNPAMYENIKSLLRNETSLELTLQPMSINDSESLKRLFPRCPTSYWAFLVEIGVGKIKGGDEPANYPAHFEFLVRPLSAEKEYYFDRQIYDGGAKGDILIFGLDSTGIAFGFDSGDDWRIVEADNHRIVTSLDLSFEDFVVGIFACYPDFPVSCSGGKWKTATGR
ncbi:hypothetical protein [Achromobacter deleyi]|uniref:hypothetical protein n=1 Tax=Achromobacter deleyi TaxID=1353891 RepID=UPI0015814529|nr:hypothetical protein [Achromobacter deleyi]